jgi:hypothetical protein
MAVASAIRYTGSALDVVLAVVLLGIAAIHAAAGVPTAVLPAVGGLVLLGAALALAPVTRHRVRQNGSSRGDLLVFGGALAVATLAVGGFVLLGRIL